MSPAGERAQIELRGLKKRGQLLAAILVLQGARQAELSRASALCATMADRCLLVAVDGGMRTCRAAGRRPDLWVGDADSFTRKLPADVDALRLPKDKKFSDLSAALSEMRQRKVQIVFVVGLAGGRIDHEWANLFELSSHSRSFAALLAPTARATIVVTRHGCKTATVKGRTFSLFSLGSSAVVSLSGTRWEMARQRLKPSSHGLSNLTGTELDLQVHSGVAALVILPPPRRRSSA